MLAWRSVLFEVPCTAKTRCGIDRASSNGVRPNADCRHLFDLRKLDASLYRKPNLEALLHEIGVQPGPVHGSLTDARYPALNCHLEPLETEP